MLVACVSTAQHSVVTGPNGQTLYGDNYGRPGSFGGYQHALIAGWRLVDTTPVGPIWTNVIHVDGTTSCQGIIDRRSGEGAGASQPGASQPGTDHEDTTATTPAEHIEAPHVLVHVEIDPVMEGKCLECLHTHIGAGPLWPTACRATPVIVSVGLSGTWVTYCVERTGGNEAIEHAFRLLPMSPSNAYEGVLTASSRIVVCVSHHQTAPC